jgi:hypothetical protein
MLLLSTILVGCGGTSSDISNPPTGNINHAPILENVPGSLSMSEYTNKIINNITCSDPDGDNVSLNVNSSNSNLIVSYNANKKQLKIDASLWDVAD